MQDLRGRFEAVVGRMAAAAGLETSRSDCTSTGATCVHLHLPGRLDCLMWLWARFTNGHLTVLTALPGEHLDAKDRTVSSRGMILHHRRHSFELCDETTMDRMLAALAETMADVTRGVVAEIDLERSLSALMFADPRRATEIVLSVVSGARTRSMLAAAIECPEGTR